MNTPIPKITQEHYIKAWDFPMGASVPTAVDICNKAIEIALAEANAQQETYITAEEARALGVGNAEWLGVDDVWRLQDGIMNPMYCVNLKYRAIQPQAQPEPVAPTCQVRNLDTGELKTITREAAKKLQAETKDTHFWFDPFNLGFCGGGFRFTSEGIYTFKLKPTVKLTIDDEPTQMYTPAQCNAETLARIDTHDVECSTKRVPKFEVLKNLPRWEEFNDEFQCQYKLIRKQKVEMWCVNGVPIVPVGNKYDVFGKGTKTMVDMLVLSKAIEALITKEFV